MKKTCHDCGVKEGHLHEFGCDMETCPNCGGQLIGCGCGITSEEDGVFEKYDRIPYVIIPNLCGRCGKKWPDMFMVPNEEWEKYVIPELQEKMLCQKCYDYMKKLFPKGWGNIE